MKKTLLLILTTLALTIPVSSYSGPPLNCDNFDSNDMVDTDCGGTNINSSGATGIPKVSGGIWSISATCSDLPLTSCGTMTMADGSRLDLSGILQTSSTEGLLLSRSSYCEELGDSTNGGVPCYGTQRTGIYLSEAGGFPWGIPNFAFITDGLCTGDGVPYTCCTSAGGFDGDCSGEEIDGDEITYTIGNLVVSGENTGKWFGAVSAFNARPTYGLRMYSQSATSRIMQRTANSDDVSDVTGVETIGLIGQRARGDSSTKTAPIQDTLLQRIKGMGYDGVGNYTSETSYDESVEIKLLADEIHSSTSQGSRIEFWTTKNNDGGDPNIPINRMTIENDGTITAEGGNFVYTTQTLADNALISLDAPGGLPSIGEVAVFTANGLDGVSSLNISEINMANGIFIVEQKADCSAVATLGELCLETSTGILWKGDGSAPPEPIGGFTTAPTYSDDPCTPGQYATDATSFYFCKATDTWDKITYSGWSYPAPTTTTTLPPSTTTTTTTSTTTTTLASTTTTTTTLVASCPSFYPSAVLSWDGDHSSGTDYVCETDGTPVHADTNGALSISTDAPTEGGSNRSVHDTQDLFLGWNDAGDEYIIDETTATAAQTLWVRVYFDGTPNNNLPFFEMYESVSQTNFVYLYLNSSGTLVGNFKSASDPSIRTVFITPTQDGWIDVGYSWYHPAGTTTPTGTHSITYVGGSDTEWVTHVVTETELGYPLTSDINKVNFGNYYTYMNAAGPGAGNEAYVIQWAIVNGYQASIPW